jgi:hypothetical protein
LVLLGWLVWTNPPVRQTLPRAEFEREADRLNAPQG